jgi:hypothetical protein
LTLGSPVSNIPAAEDHNNNKLERHDSESLGAELRCPAMIKSRASALTKENLRSWGAGSRLIIVEERSNCKLLNGKL